MNPMRSLRLTPRRVAGVLCAAAAAVALSGCVVVKNVASSQLNSIGSVQISATMCVANTAGTCPEQGNTTVNAGNNNQNVQLFVAYRVTAGAIPPASLRFSDDGGSGPLFTPNASYTAELQRLAPAAAGQQWFGYTSTLFNYVAGSSPTSGVILAQFGLPAGPVGVPFTGPFSQRVVVGTRAIDATHPIASPVACGATLTDFNSTGSDGQTVCIDSPSAATSATSQTQSTRDLAVTAGAAPTAAPGTAASVPFSLQFAGTASSNLIFGLTATTTIPGATPVVSPATLTPTTNSTTPVLATVPVPAATPAGTYPVTLTATVAGQVRTAQAAITVTGTGGGGTTALPRVSNLSVSPRVIFRGRRARPATLKVTLSDPGTLRVGISRAVSGRRNVNGRCVAPNRTLINKGARKCTRFVSVGSITKANQAAGRRSVTFSGRGRAAGLYRLTVTARSTAGLQSLPKLVSVTVSS